MTTLKKHVPDLFFQNTRTGKRYKVLELDNEKGEIILERDGHKFKERYSKERFRRLGYKLVKDGEN